MNGQTDMERREAIAGEARRLLDAGVIVWDTETTGLDEQSEIVEIAAVDASGRILMDTLIRPRRPIPAAASSIHGIRDTDVQAAPAWADLHGAVVGLLSTRPTAIYNADYDLRLLDQTAEQAGLRRPELRAWCVMRGFAAWRGIPRENGEWKWAKLAEAARACGVVLDGAAHRARADALMTLGVLRWLARSAS